MFERIMEHARGAAARLATSRISELTEQIRSRVPTNIEVSAQENGIRLSGRALRRRFALDPALRWLLAGLK